jgi:8-oxo-dGTP pyrophosphatase MutT (NUDIX family)
MFDLRDIRNALKALNPVRLQADAELEGRASVAVIFAGEPEEPALCFIRRADRDDDHWSGHMAFPGGRAEPRDTTPRSIAERETAEEIGLSLGDVEYLGPLSELWIRHSGIVTKQVLAPFVYYAGIEHPAFTNSEEVAEGYWIPVRQLWAPANRTTIEYERKGRKVVLPGIRHDGQIIWGLTYMMLCAIGELVKAPLPAPEPDKL